MKLSAIFILFAAILLPAAAGAQQPQPETIYTVKGVHSVDGTWLAAGPLTGAGPFVTARFSETASGAPNFVVTHVSYFFSNADGTFRLNAQITETVTADPLVLVDEGRWTIVGQSGAYATLRGTGSVSGTVDHHSSTVIRTYQGEAHL